MKSDAASEDTTRILADKQKLAQELGISGTPAFIVNDQIIRGYLEEGAMKDRIAAARAAKKS